MSNQKNDLVLHHMMLADWPSNQQWGGQHQTDTRWLVPHLPAQRRSPGSSGAGTGWRTLQTCVSVQQPAEQKERPVFCEMKKISAYSELKNKSLSRPQGQLLILLCDDATGGTVDGTQDHLQVLQHSPGSLLSMTSRLLVISSIRGRAHEQVTKVSRYWNWQKTNC